MKEAITNFGAKARKAVRTYLPVVMQCCLALVATLVFAEYASAQDPDPNNTFLTSELDGNQSTLFAIATTVVTYTMGIVIGVFGLVAALKVLGVGISYITRWAR